jgi:hypothetical protein
MTLPLHLVGQNIVREVKNLFCFAIDHDAYKPFRINGCGIWELLSLRSSATVLRLLSTAARTGCVSSNLTHDDLMRPNDLGLTCATLAIFRR